MAHSDGIRVVRYRSFEEICFNVRTYHNCGPADTDWDSELMRSLAGTETRIIFANENAANIPYLNHGTDCGLPVFQVVGNPGAYVCAHLCEID